MRVRGHSASLKLIPFESLGAVSYSIFIWRYFVSYARSSDLLVENHEIFIPHLYLAPPQGGDRVNISRMCLIGYSYSSVTVRSLLPVHERGTALLILIGDRAFAVAGPRAWNSLPSDIRTSTPSFDTFKKHLKSYLFQLSFSSL